MEFYVTPAKTIPHNVLRLSSWDQIAPKYYIRRHFVFKQEPTSDSKLALYTLKAGLSHALVEYPRFAGKITPCNADRKTTQIELGEDQGVPVVCKDLRESPDVDSFDEFRDQGFPQHKLVPNNFEPPGAGSIHGTDRADCLKVQITLIKNGLVLTICDSHQISDWSTGAALMKCWSRHCKIESGGGQHSTALPEVDDIYALPLTDGAVGEWKIEDFPLLLYGDGFEDHLAKEMTMQSQRDMTDSPGRSSSVETTTWVIRSAKMAKLKTISVSSNPSDQWVSSIDALSGFLWKRVSIARELGRSKYEISKLLIAYNVRSALSLSAGYQGNCATCVEAVSSVQELCDGQGSLWPLASRIRRAILGFDAADFGRLIGFINTVQDVTRFRISADASAGPDLLITDQARYGEYEMDWGKELGRIQSSRRSHVNPNGIVTLLGRLPDEGGTEFAVSLSNDVSQRLRNDPAFLEYVEFRG